MIPIDFSVDGIELIYFMQRQDTILLVVLTGIHILSLLVGRQIGF